MTFRRFSESLTPKDRAHLSGACTRAHAASASSCACMQRGHRSANDCPGYSESMMPAHILANAGLESVPCHFCRCKSWCTSVAPRTVLIRPDSSLQTAVCKKNAGAQCADNVHAVRLKRAREGTPPDRRTCSSSVSNSASPTGALRPLSSGCPSAPARSGSWRTQTHHSSSGPGHLGLSLVLLLVCTCKGADAKNV